MKTKEQIAAERKVYYQANKEKLKEYQKAYTEANKDAKNEYLRNYQRMNKERKNARHKERFTNDPLYRLTHNIRGIIYKAVKEKTINKLSKTELILGCNFEQFKEHLENQFEDWMCWDNYGNPKDGIFEPNKTWDIDHIKPVSSGLTESELINLNHYTNLKPLCSYYNRWIKKDKAAN